MKASFTWTVRCDACDWQYPPPRGKGTIAVKSDCEQQARAHRLHGCLHAAQTRLDETA